MCYTSELIGLGTEDERCEPWTTIQWDSELIGLGTEDERCEPWTTIQWDAISWILLLHEQYRRGILEKSDALRQVSECVDEYFPQDANLDAVYSLFI